MEQKLRKYYILITCFFLLVIALLSFLLYQARQDALALVKEQFNEEQSLLAKQTAIGIRENFAIVTRELELLANRCAVKTIDLGQVQGVMAETFDHVKKNHVSDIIFVDSDGIVKTSLNTPELLGNDFSKRDYFLKASSLVDDKPVFEFIEMPGDQSHDEYGIVISRPIYSEDDLFGGVIFFILRLHDLIEGHFSASTGNTQTWVIDQNSNILFHPKIKTGASILEEASKTESFRTFINAAQTIGDYKAEYVSPKGERILAASYPARIADQIWSIIINTPASNFSSHFIRLNSMYSYLTISALLIIMGGSLMMVIMVNKWNRVLQKENSERVHAEKELQKAHDELEKRIKERTAELHDMNEYLANEIEERKIAEAEIVKQNEMVRNTIESLSHPFYVIDAESYVIQMANSAADFGTLTETSTCYQLTHQKDRPCDCKDHPCTIREIKQKLKPVTLQHVHYSDGEERIFEVHGYPIFDRQGRVKQVIEYSIDVTESRKLEEQLHQSQKMESIGRLAGGVAHDFNNILTAIIGFSELAQQKLPLDHPVMRDLKIVGEAGERAAILVKKLLAFSRKQIMEMRVVNLHELIEDVLKLLSRTIGEDVTINLNTENDIDKIKADPGQIEQILMNLFINARDAMPAGGRISIETSNITLDEDYTKEHEGVEPGAYVMLAITDTGKGMPRQVQEKIFEPFYTTKGTRGTGLGLSTVYGIVRQHKGHIFVYSEEELGTTFKIYFPSTEEKSGKHKKKLHAVFPKGNETLLIVDDDTSIRSLIIDTLQPLGYAVTDAGSAEEILELLAGTDSTFDLLLTDMVMPGMNGRELAGKVKEIYPQIKVIFMSGYTSDMIANQGELKSGEVFIQKPLSPLNLAGKIREVLDSNIKNAVSDHN
jgi:signal transduction histidine kinase